MEKYTTEYKHGRHCCVYDGASEAKMWLPSFPKNFVRYLLHRIFVHMYVMYVALNVVEKNNQLHSLTDYHEINLLSLVNLWLDIIYQVTMKYTTVPKPKLFHQLNTP